ncbi:hypothetical protein P4H32_30390 [Bacillus cereus]|nr:hypothetical protein [Bacillus cereus]
MEKVCAKHRTHPVKIYVQCVGCEIEYHQNRILELEAKIKDLQMPKATVPTESAQA